MATQRIFGPIRGAGVQIREREPERNIVPATLGSTVVIGVFERGEEDGITVCPSKTALKRKNGGLLDTSDFNARSFSSLEAPRAASEFWSHSEGAGVQVNLRVVPKTNDASNDDRPVKSTISVFNREDEPKIIGYLEALNGGRWAGQRKYFQGIITGTPATDFPQVWQVQLDGITTKDFARDEFKGGTIHIHGITTKTYTIVSNDSDGLFTCALDEDIDADWTAAGPPTDLNVTVYRDNTNARDEEKRLTVEFRNGTLDPLAYFGVQIKVDDEVMLDYENLSMDDTSPYYWVDVINTDPNNDLVNVVDNFTGNRLAATARPANHFGLSSALTSTVLTIADPYIDNISGTWTPVLSAISWNSLTVPQRLRVTVTDDTPSSEILTISTDKGNRTLANVAADLSLGISFTMDEYGIDFTVTAPSSTVGDYFEVYLRPLWPDELIGGKVNPDVTDTKEYTIVDNDRTTVTVNSTQDLTDGGSLSGGEQFRLQWEERMWEGYDGYVAGMVSSDYEGLLDAATSPLLKLKSMNLGLVKFCIPGIATPSEALALQQKCITLAEAYNWQYRVEIPDEYETEQGALDWINNSLGRSDLGCVFLPSQMYIRDPLADSGSDAREELVSVVGMQLGREAKVARDYDGYHKAGAGVDVTLPLVTRAPILGRPDNPQRLNEELLNPAGINAYRWASGGGTIIAWGDRTLDSTTAFRFKHKREQLSHYENVLIENFDWAIFDINDPESDAEVSASLHRYFLNEYRKRAIRGSTFVGGRNPAAIIKVDDEINTDATRAQGNKFAEVSLRFADVTERLIITMGAMGLTESLS